MTEKRKRRSNNEGCTFKPGARLPEPEPERVATAEPTALVN
ncbi:MAG TPA: hypothetical protein VOA41_11695 [Candidatus Dormibacteraeota bacterium]|nr:hypothetical protein [Candidatus Dormibacteraeota bacterium]